MEKIMKQISIYSASVSIIISLVFLPACKTTPSAVDTSVTPLEKVETGKKILVVYFSRTGNTERVAKDIAGALSADIEKIYDKDRRTGCLGLFSAGMDGMGEVSAEIEPVKNNAADYDIVIIGSPVWAWNMTPAIRAYIEQNKMKLKDVAFFITSGGSTIEEMQPFMEKLSGKKPVKSLGIFEEELNQPKVYRTKLKGFVEFFRKTSSRKETGKR